MTRKKGTETNRGRINKAAYKSRGTRAHFLRKARQENVNFLSSKRNKFDDEYATLINPLNKYEFFKF